MWKCMPSVRNEKGNQSNYGERLQKIVQEIRTSMNIQGFVDFVDIFIFILKAVHHYWRHLSGEVTVKNCKWSEVLPYLQCNRLAWNSFMNANKTQRFLFYCSRKQQQRCFSIFTSSWKSSSHMVMQRGPGDIYFHGSVPLVRKFNFL